MDGRAGNAGTDPRNGYSAYLKQLLPLLRGRAVARGNILPEAVITEKESGTKRYNAAVARSPELTSIVVPIRRQRGIDGLTISIKRTPLAPETGG